MEILLNRGEVQKKKRENYYPEGADLEIVTRKSTAGCTAQAVGKRYSYKKDFN